MKHGEVIAKIRPKRASKLDDLRLRAKYERALAGLKDGVPGLVGPAIYEERTERWPCRAMPASWFMPYAAATSAMRQQGA